MTREQAWALLAQYNKEPFHLRHAITVEHVMGWFAQKLGYGEEKEFWSLVGLLHDLDFEMWPDDHCIKSQELMREAGVDEAMIRATACHGWGHCVDIKRPSKSVADMELKSLKKKFKDKKFAAGCSRDVIAQGAELLGWDLDKLLDMTLSAMRDEEEAIEAAVAAL